MTNPPDQPHAQEVVSAPKGRRPWIVMVVIVLLAVIAAATVSFIEYGGNIQSTSDAYIEGRVIRISPRVSGPVLQLNVDDNTPVKAGDTLLEIDPADFQAKVDQAAAALAAANSDVEEAKAAVLSADAAVGEAQAALDAARTDANRARIRLSPLCGHGNGRRLGAAVGNFQRLGRRGQ